MTTLPLPEKLAREIHRVTNILHGIHVFREQPAGMSYSDELRMIKTSLESAMKAAGLDTEAQIAAVKELEGYRS